MSGDQAKVTAMRERARAKLKREQQQISEGDKNQLADVQKRLRRKMRSSLPASPPPVPVPV